MSEKQPLFDYDCHRMFIGVPVATTIGGQVSYGYVAALAVTAILPAPGSHSDRCHLFLQGDRTPITVQASVAETLTAISNRAG